MKKGKQTKDREGSKQIRTIKQQTADKDEENTNNQQHIQLQIFSNFIIGEQTKIPQTNKQTNKQIK